MKNLFLRRKQTELEEKLNMLTHAIGGIIYIVLFILMLVKCNSILEYIGSSIFFAGMFALYLGSSLYHGISNEKKKILFQKMDHLSIYLLIGGTFAPILLVTINSVTSYIFLACQWIIIAVGIYLTIKYGVKKYTKLQMFFYILLGWSGILFVPTLFKINPSLVFYIALGGIVYSIGILFYKMRNVKYMHVIWHFFVFFGTFFQFLGIYLYVI